MSKRKLGLTISRIPEEKRYEYIRKVELEGYTRLRAYAEVIDPSIYDISPSAAQSRLKYLKESGWKDYDIIKENVLAEREDNIFRASVAAQEKSMKLLNATLDKAIAIAEDPDTDVKTLAAAIQTLKVIMPALAKKEEPREASVGVKANAVKYIH